MKTKNRVLRLVLNGKAAGNEVLREAVLRLRNEGASIEVRVTWEAGDAARYAQEVGDDADYVVLAGGGDGTVNEVANGMLCTQPAASMGIVPFGTANDFATSAGIPVGDPYEALKLGLTGKPVPIDVGQMNGRYFINVASGGFGAEVTSQTSPGLKRTIGGSAYALTALVLALNAHPYRGRLTLPDQTIDGAMVMMAVGNGKQAGGGAVMTPHARIDDGMLDVMVIPAHKGEHFSHLLAELMEIKLSGGEHFHYLRAPWVKIEAEDELQFNLDGEPVRGREFEFSVHAKRLPFILPPTCQLLT